MAVSPFIRLASIRSNPLGDRTASHTGIALYSRSEPPRARKSVHAYAKRPPRQRLRCVLGIAQQLGGESPLANQMEVKA